MVAKNLKVLRFAIKAASNFAKGRIPILSGAEPVLQPVYVSVPNTLPRAAFFKQSRRWLSTKSFAETVRQFGTTSAKAFSGGTKSRYASSRIGQAIRQSTGHAPFASTLRPNLTGGAFSRSAGGYGLGSGRLGGQRYFSHTPQAPAQVINDVSQAMRAFMLGGKKLHYDGMDPGTGEKRFKTVSSLQDKATMKMINVPRATSGSFIDFNINPTVTALAPMTMSAVPGYKPANSMDTLHSEGLLDILSIDFTRALHELALIMSDLRSCSALGDLPISYQHNRLRVHFPGVDPETVESLAAELGIKRGVIGQDSDFDSFVGAEIALLFPFAPSDGGSVRSLNDLPLYSPRESPMQEMDALSSPTTLSDTGLAYEDMEAFSSGSEDFETIPSRSYAFESSPRSVSRDRRNETPFEYQDFEGIYRFIELCDNARQ